MFKRFDNFFSIPSSRIKCIGKKLIYDRRTFIIECFIRANFSRILQEQINNRSNQRR